MGISPRSASYGRDEEQNDEHHEKNLPDPCGSASDGREAENAGKKGENEKCDAPA